VTQPLGRRLAAGLVFIAVTMMFGIITHLTSELAGLGPRVDLALILSARHTYLGVIGVSCIVAALSVALWRTPGAREARIASLTAALPFKGQGPGFVAAAFLAQVTFSVVLAALLAAVLTAALGAFAVALGKRRFLAFIVALAWPIRRAAAAPVEELGMAHVAPLAADARCTPFSFRYRPPPQAA
jgi:hypothetical protein